MSGWITTGPKNQELEEAFCHLTGNQHAIAVCSATAGMHVTLMALNIGPGDEVITPSQTWVSTLNMIVLLGATPVMIDVDNDTLMVTPDAVEAAISPSIMLAHRVTSTRFMPLANVTVFPLLKMLPMPPEPITRTAMWAGKGRRFFPSTPLKI